MARIVGRRIRTLRLEAGFTFDAFVEETQLGRGYVSELERGLVVPSLAVLDRVAKAIGVTIADLVAGDTARERLFLRLRTATSEAISGAERAALAYKDRPADVFPLAEPRRPRRGS